MWIEPERPGEFDVPVGARVLAVSSVQRLRVLDDEEREQDVDTSRCLVMHVGSVPHLDDMIKLNDLSEHSLLRNLLVRYKKTVIYVRYDHSYADLLERTYHMSCFCTLTLPSSFHVSIVIVRVIAF